MAERNLGRALVAWRGSRTVVSVATATGLSRTTIKRYEDEESASVPVDNLRLLVHYYGRTMHDVATVLDGPQDPISIAEADTLARATRDPSQIEYARRIGILEDLVGEHDEMFREIARDRKKIDG